MPSKHIQNPTWDKVEEQYKRAIIATKTSFKETEILNLIINKGLESISEEDYIRAAAIKNAKKG